MKSIKAFISYNWAEDVDKDISHLSTKLKGEIKNSFGLTLDIFRDKEGNRAGQNFWNTINRNIDASDVFILIWSRSYFESEGCRKELKRILEL